MSEEPFLYFFCDEHKIVTIRAEPTFKERIEKLLHAFHLEESTDPAGADAAAHEHRGVLLVPKDRPELLSHEEIVERLRDSWKLLLNIDPESNVDDEGAELGITPWRCVVRAIWPGIPPRYAEVLLRAGNLREAEDRAFDAVQSLAESDGHKEWEDAVIVTSDRLLPEDLKRALGGKKARKSPPLPAEVERVTWLE